MVRRASQCNNDRVDHLFGIRKRWTRGCWAAIGRIWPGMRIMKRVAVITNVVPHYRRGFYERVLRRPDFSTTVYCQRSVHGGLDTIHSEFPESICEVDHRAWRGETVVWQQLPWSRLAHEYEIIFVDGNPRNVAQFALAYYLRSIGRKVVVWSSVHSFSDSASRERLRISTWRPFRNFLLYTERDCEELRARGFDGRVLISINNGLDQERIDDARARWPVSRLQGWREREGFGADPLLVSSGRLIAKNCFHEVLEALVLLRDEGIAARWVLIGAGPEEERLRADATRLGLLQAVRFVGALRDEAELAPYFAAARALVHPAAIGLALLHAFGYGLPVVTHNNSRRHGPEFSLFRDGATGLSFPEHDVAALAAVLRTLLQGSAAERPPVMNALTIARDQHNTAVMAERFARMVTEAE